MPGTTSCTARRRRLCRRGRGRRGPAGSSAAWWLAGAGLDVVVLEKAALPREKVCGDGLTPLGVQALVDMGIAPPGRRLGPAQGAPRHGGGQVVEVDWPTLARWPDYSLVRRRSELDALLAGHAQDAGARLHTEVTVTDPLLDEAGRVVGVAPAPGRTSSPAPGARRWWSPRRGSPAGWPSRSAWSAARTARSGSPSAATSARGGQPTSTSTSPST